MDAVVDFHVAGAAAAAAEGRLHVTMTYAQSLDGCISAVRGQPTLLSSPESMTMTHQLRTLHDGILVGIGTITADDPSLTVRLVEGPSPQPIVVDPHLMLPITCKLLTLPTCKRPWILTPRDDWDSEKLQRKSALEALGARIIVCDAATSATAKHISWRDAFGKLHALGLMTLMIEGGAAILTSCLEEHARMPVLNHAIITIAPIYIGGLHAVTRLITEASNPRLQQVQSCAFGTDIVILGKF
ncbi:riboflavin-specific deaminase/GTP cyclohydrolase II [Achlya hypogyna]|uniref:Riboflavin-specific deaminase/GTP cyclohydrolase II n=1 Tax=Achlya hypogyna TaxID=1202772 RepID=A0A1V9Z119_ACHHY|nr:riboflavin-specific deaminase/GTP cyclohydrolase II [Achlya hypogyna]